MPAISVDGDSGARSCGGARSGGGADTNSGAGDGSGDAGDVVATISGGLNATVDVVGSFGGVDATSGVGVVVSSLR